jgi:hypothetical protein
MELYAGRNPEGVLNYPPAADVAEAKEWIEKGKADIREKMRELPVHSGMSPYEIELSVYDWLCENVIYSTDDEADPTSMTLHGAIVGGKANCNGMGEAFQYILSHFGVECLVLYVTTSGAHANNAIKLDGEWYQADVTAGAGLYESDNLPYHYYFNRTGQFMTDNEIILGIEFTLDTMNPNITCTGTKYDYYKMTNSHIASDADFISKAPARIAAARTNGEPAFELEFAPGYAQASDIYDKRELIDSSLWADIKFLYVESRGIVFGRFEK